MADCTEVCIQYVNLLDVFRFNGCFFCSHLKSAFKKKIYSAIPNFV